MCTLCLATGTFDPTRHDDGTDPLFQNLNEITAAPDNTNTVNSMSVGDSFSGTLSDGNDEDWVEITFVAGETYEISLTGDTLSDPYLWLRDGSGNLVDSNDDSVGLNSSINYTATSSGTYYIVADAYATETGSYTLTVDSSVPLPPTEDGTLDEMALFLTEGYWGREVTFDTSSSNVITVNLSGLTADGRQLARWAMEAWEMVADVDFVEVASGEMITMDDESSGAFAYAPGGSGSDGVELNVSRDWVSDYGTSIDSYSYQTYVHEIGHAIGLGHQGSYNGSATYGSDETFANDSWQLSVMSYFSQTGNTSTDASYAYLAGPMMVDILAIQNLYGAPGSSTATAGNTIYGANSNLGNYLDEVFDAMATGRTTSNVTDNAMAFTLYDQSGIDTLDISFLTSGARLDMREEQFSDFAGLTGIMGIARGTVLERAILGVGNDTVTGNSADNEIFGGSGSDSIDGGDGNDLIRGGSNVGTAVDSLFGEGGNDRIFGDGGYDLLDGGDGNDWLDGGNQADNLYGRTGEDMLIGGGGLDRLFGGTENDTLMGGQGTDALFGQQGSDTLEGGTENDRLFGGSGNDDLDGGADDDVLNGGSGFDIIDGGAGNDTLAGNFNADTFVFADGHGNDTVSDFAATNNFERIDLNGVSAIRGLGDLQLGNASGGAATQVGSDVVIDTGGGNSITLSGVSLGDLDSADFIF